MTRTNILRAARFQLVGLVVMVAGLVAASSANAETSTASMNVSVNVVANCTIRSNGTQAVTTACSNGATGVVTLGQALSANSSRTTSGTNPLVAMVTF